MNYYERHLGDYARDAGHLSMLEHGAYGLLLDRYYTTERGIPDDQAHRICRARTKEERAAVDAVLSEFFTLRDGVWTNGRAEREIAKTQAKVKAARENGKRGGRPKQSEKKPSGLSPGSISETQVKAHQTPDTRHQTPEYTTTENHHQLAGGRAGAHDSAAVMVEAVAPTAAGGICRRLRQAGIADVNPGHPRLLALIDAGATVDEFVGFASAAIDKGAGFAWVLGAVEGERTRAKTTADRVQAGRLPNKREMVELGNRSIAQRWAEGGVS